MKKFIKDTGVSSQIDNPGIYVNAGKKVTIDGVTFDGGMNFGILAETGSGSIINIKNSVFKGINIGVYFNNNASGIIENNEFDTMEYAAIGIDSDGVVKINNNTIKKSPIGLEIFGDNTTYSGNTFTDVDTHIKN